MMSQITAQKKAAVMVALKNSVRTGRFKFALIWMFGERRELCFEGVRHVLAKWDGEWFHIRTEGW